MPHETKALGVPYRQRMFDRSGLLSKAWADWFYRQEKERIDLVKQINFNYGSFGLPKSLGRGNLGDVTLSVDTTLNSHQIYEYRNLTINAAVTLTTVETATALLVLIVKETLRVKGTIDMIGKGTPTGGSTPDSHGASGGSGGGGDVGSSSGGGSTVVSGGVPAGVNLPGNPGSALNLSNLFRFRYLDRKNTLYTCYGAAGGVGGSGFTGSVGLGGKGGGATLIVANRIIMEAGSLITTDANAGDAGSGTSGSGGGGGAGLQYYLAHIYDKKGTQRANGGAGGVGGNQPGGAGGNGTIVEEEIP